METTSSTTTTTTTKEEEVVSAVENTISKVSSFRPTKLEIILSIVVVGLIIFLCFFKTNGNADQNARLTDEVKALQKQKDSVVNNIQNLESKYKTLQSDSIKEQQKLVLIDQKLNIITQTVNTSVQSATKQKVILDSINKKIDKQISKPSTKTGDDLLNSLKSKLN